MSGKPAARAGDSHVCPLSDGPKPHVGGPILPPCEPTVLIGGQPAARMFDSAQCASPAPDQIAAGAFPVPIGGKPATRIGDLALHGGSVTSGCPTVLIGLAGVAGNVLMGTAMCRAAGAGRASQSSQQSYNNCGVESSRQIINHSTGANLTENGLLTTAINNGLAEGTPGGALSAASGGTSAIARQAILASNGVPSTIVTTSAESLGLALSRGQGVIASLDAAFLWGPPTPPGSLHAVTVTGVEYDDAGNRTAVVINDTGTGQCGQRVPAGQFDRATSAHPNSQVNVTVSAIW